MTALMLIGGRTGFFMTNVALTQATSSKFYLFFFNHKFTMERESKRVLLFLTVSTGLFEHLLELTRETGAPDPFNNIEQYY